MLTGEARRNETRSRQSTHGYEISSSTEQRVAETDLCAVCFCFHGLSGDSAFLQSALGRGQRSGEKLYGNLWRTGGSDHFRFNRKLSNLHRTLLELTSHQFAAQILKHSRNHC